MNKRSILTGIVALPLAATLAITTMGAAAVPSQAALSTTSWNVTDSSDAGFWLVQDTGKMEPTAQQFGNGDTVAFSLPGTSPSGHSSGDAIYSVYSGSGPSLGTIDVHLDAADWTNSTITFTNTSGGHTIGTLKATFSTGHHSVYPNDITITGSAS